MKVKFKGWHCLTRWGAYDAGGAAALQLIEDGTGERIATASTNPPEIMPPGCMAIKDWFENEGMTASLVAAGAIEPDRVSDQASGHVMIGIHRLTPAALAEFQRRSVRA